MDELGKVLGRARFSWIGLSLLFPGISFLSRARRWMLLIEPLGFKPGYWSTYHALMIGYLSNYALPRLGELTRCVSLGRKEKIPVDSLIGTVIIERVVDVLMLMVILLILVFSWAEKFGAFFTEQVWHPLQRKFIAVFGASWVFWLLIFALLFSLVLFIWIFRKRLKNITLAEKILSFFKGITDGIKTIYRMERKWEFILHSLLIWFFYILMTWVVVFALEETSGLTFIDGMFLLVIGGLGMSAPVTAGFGAYHWITSRGLVYVYGLSLELGGAYAILAHESNSLLTILLGALSYLVFLGFRKRKQVQM